MWQLTLCWWKYATKIWYLSGYSPMKRLLRSNQVAIHFKQSFIYRKVSPVRNVMKSHGTDTRRILHPLLPGLQLFGLREIKCATDTLPSKERSSFDIEFCPEYCCSKTLVWFSRFRNCLEEVRSSNSDWDMSKRVIAFAHWSPLGLRSWTLSKGTHNANLS